MKTIPAIFLMIIMATNVAAQTDEIVVQTISTQSQYALTETLSEMITYDSIVQIGIGLLASLLLTVSIFAYLRERRIKYLLLMLAFLVFTLKGILGFIDLLFPNQASVLLPLSDSLDLLILLLFFIAVIKE